MELDNTKTVKFKLDFRDDFMGIVRNDNNGNTYIDFMDENDNIVESFMFYTGEWMEICRVQREKNQMYKELFKNSVLRS